MTDLFGYVEQAKAAGRLDLALLEFGDLIEARLGGIQPFHRRADLLRSMGRHEEARADYCHAARMEPENPWPMLWLAQFSFEQEQRWLAAADIAEAMRRDPVTAEFRVNAAKFFGALDWLDLAWSVVRDLPEDMGDWWGRERQTAQERYRACCGYVRAQLQAYSKGDQCDPKTCLDLARELFKLGRLRMARTLCEQLMAQEPCSFPAFEVHAWIVARSEGAAAAHAFLCAMHFLHAGGESYLGARDMFARQIPPPPELIPKSPQQ